VQNQQGVDRHSDYLKQLHENYVGKDQNWQVKPFSGYIYINGSDASCERMMEVLRHRTDPQHFPTAAMPEDGIHPGISGFFTDEKTASASFKEDGGYNSRKLMDSLQQAPYVDKSVYSTAIDEGTKLVPVCHNSLICLRINKEKLKELYGTEDFLAAQSVCTENSDWGDGGGMQGYNPFMNQMINEGVLEIVPEKCRADDHRAYLDYYARKKRVVDKAFETAAAIRDRDGDKTGRLGHNELVPLQYRLPPAQKTEQHSDGGQDTPPPKKSALLSAVRSASKLQLGLFAGMLAGMIITFCLCGSKSFLSGLFWFAAVSASFVMMLALCLKTNGLPKFFRSKVGGYILTAFTVLWFILVVPLVKLMIFLFSLALAFFVLKVVTLFGPSGTITITRVDEDGRSTQETRAVYGDMNAEMSRVENQLKSEGYTDIRRQ